MDLWQVLVLALLKQGIDCDFDRLAELASKHLDVRRMLGLPDGFAEPRFTHRTLARNVILLTPVLLRRTLLRRAASHRRERGNQRGLEAANAGVRPESCKRRRPRGRDPLWRSERAEIASETLQDRLSRPHR